MQADVPLWVALQLKRKGKCTVVWPRWLHKGSLPTATTFLMVVLTHPLRACAEQTIWR